MIKNLILIQVAGVLLFTSFSHALSLEGAQQVALENSPGLRADRASVDVSEAALTRSSSRFYPKLGVETRYEYFDSTFMRQQGATSNFFAEWSLFNGFQDFAARKARSLELEASRLNFNLAQQRLNWEVEAAFSRVVAHQEVLILYKAALDRNQANLKAARGRRSAGVVSDADVLEFDLYESILRSEYAEAEGDLREVQAQFKTLLGADDIKFPLSGAIPRYKLISQLEELTTRLTDSNVAIKTSLLDVKRANAERNVARGGFLPEIGVFATYGSLGLRETEISPETYAGVIARWELFSGFDTLGARREAIANVARAEAGLKTAQIAKKGELEEVHERLKALDLRIQLEERNHETAHKYLRTVVDEYRRGVKNSPDLKSANENMLQSHLREVQLKSEYVAQATLLRTLVSGNVQFEKMKSELRREEK